MLAKPRARTLIVIGVCALVLGTLLTYLTYRTAESDRTAGPAADRTAEASPTDASEPTPTEAPEPPRTDRVVSKRGGFSVAAPVAFEVRRQRRTVRLTSQEPSLVVNVGPGERGDLRQAHRQFVRTLRTTYRRLDVMATERLEVDGRPAISAAGLATNSAKVRIRFVVVTVRARPANYTIAAYTTRDSDPGAVLPLVNAVVNGFKVLR